jgi:hypothetical protein
VIPTFTFRIVGDVAVAQGLDRLRGGFADANEAVLRPLGARYVDVLQAETPEGRGEKPGRLRAGYDTEESYTASAGRFRILNQTPHIGYVLRGRGPITARGRALRFVIDGQVIFRKRVGPAAPNPFDQRARQAMQPALDRLAPQLADAMIRVYRGGL